MLRHYLQQVVFDWPWLLAALPLLPLLAWWMARRQRGKLVSWRLSAAPPPINPTWRTRLRNLPLWLRWSAIAMLVVAMARPASYRTIELTQGQGIDIVLCLDVSGSMLARDFNPDRLRASIEVARNFVERRKGDSIGLVIFSGQSLSLAPLTTDHNAIMQQLGKIDYGVLADGTAIGTGLASAVDRLRQGNAKSKVVILLTDGENTGGLIDPPTARELAKTFGIKVYTIGVGTTGTAPMPYQTPTGTIMQDEKVSIDEALLQSIAQQTGGQYFRATNKQALQNIYSSIDSLEKTKVETQIFTKRTDKFFPWLTAAIVLLMAELALRWGLLRRFP